MTGDQAVMNVTPAEFDNIRLAASRLSAADFAAFMHRWYNCSYFSRYALKVRRDVPQVPWLSRGVERFELKR
jgi:hypothetical protein